MPRTASLLSLLALAAPLAGAAGQDVEMLGERYGTPVPGAYERMRRADPTAFEFRRGLVGGSGVEVRSFEGGSGGGPALTLGPRDEAVVGTFEIPVLLGLYGNSGATPPFSRTTIQEAYFGDGPGTITAYYAEVSSDRLSFLGDVRGWVQTARADTTYTVDESGLVSGPLGGGGAGNFVWDVLELQSGVDWGLYDNDGPDGIPNSGDDDGYVDVLAVIHPTRGAECGGSGSEDRIWSHRWSLSSAIRDAGPYQTDTPSANGGYIKVDDYTIQPAISCDGGELNEIGVFTHELGHAFGLPDLYDTCSDGSCPEDTARTSGAGIWDLMASGSWGCDNASPESPCHMGAWTKEALGWVDVVTLAPDTDHGTITVPPVVETGTVYRVDANDGSGEYFLLENRQRQGFDQDLYREGLLVWQIDPDWVLDRWAANRVNANEHLGVWLRQADGEDDLGEGVGRGDAGDPFPGSTANTAFHTVTDPASLSWGGGVTGVTLFEIAGSGDDMTLRLSTRFTSVGLDADGATSTDSLFTLDGQTLDSASTTFSSAPFVPHAVEATEGELVAPGERRPFVDWLDDPAVERARTVTTPLVDTTFVARYGGTEYRLTLSTTGGVNAVDPATFESDPFSDDLWFDDGTSVSLQAVPRTGFAFLRWTGGLESQPNPASFTMLEPLAAGADFELIYDVTETQVELPAATPLEVQLMVENGTEPVSWTLIEGALPVGLRMSRTGTISGSALDTGSFQITVEAVDAVGLPATGTVVLDLLEPELSIEQLTSTFLLSGPELTDDQINFLNLQGNRVAPYDVGDFRAWVLDHPTLPFSAETGAVHRRTVVIGSTGNEHSAGSGSGGGGLDGGAR